MGCRKIAHISGPEGLQIFEQRREGYKKALEANQLTFDPKMIKVCEGDDIDKGQSVTEELLTEPNHCDGIFAPQWERWWP